MIIVFDSKTNGFADIKDMSHGGFCEISLTMSITYMNHFVFVRMRRPWVETIKFIWLNYGSTIQHIKTKEL